MHALEQDETCAEEIRNPADALAAEVTRQVRHRLRPTTQEYLDDLAAEERKFASLMGRYAGSLEAQNQVIADAIGRAESLLVERATLIDRIARLESSRRYYAVVLVAVALVSAVLARAWL